MSVVELHRRYVTIVDDLPAAWVFVMAHVDQLGPCPQISISPVWWFDTDTRGESQRFEVSVSGSEEIA